MGRDLKPITPIDPVTVTTASGELLAPDNEVNGCECYNKGVYDVWAVHADYTAEVGKGFLIPAGGLRQFTEQEAPQLGLNAIADGGSSLVYIGLGGGRTVFPSSIEPVDKALRALRVVGLNKPSPIPIVPAADIDETIDDTDDHRGPWHDVLNLRKAGFYLIVAKTAAPTTLTFVIEACHDTADTAIILGYTEVVPAGTITAGEVAEAFTAAAAGYAAYIDPNMPIRYIRAYLVADDADATNKWPVEVFFVGTE